MNEFSMKLAPKDKEEITKFKNFYSIKTSTFKKYAGKIIYTNHEYPDQYIFRAYFVVGGTGHPISYSPSGSMNKEHPSFSLQELDYEDVIIFYEKDDIKPKV